MRFARGCVIVIHIRLMIIHTFNDDEGHQVLVLMFVLLTSG